MTSTAYYGLELVRATDTAGEAFLERVATLISPCCSGGLDTSGQPWTPN